VSSQEQATFSPFDELVGVQFEEGSGERVVATVSVRAEHHQPTGIVHGGVYTTLVEGLASTGATLWLVEEGREEVAVGVSNHTDFLRAVSGGVLRGEALPIQRGRLLQLWQVTVTDEEERVVAHGKVKLVNRPLPAGFSPPAGS
jgi:1,4-dihydroxy-2-naphthoyl-CoA hydrolase